VRTLSRVTPPVAALVPALALTLGACAPDELGACDDDRARTAAFVAASDADVTGLAGQPLFEGQALLAASCGNGVYCHAARATGGLRHGVPGGFDLDVGIACDARAPSVACDSANQIRLQQGRDNVWAFRTEILAAVRDGSMPPGDVGTEVRRQAPQFVRADGSALPGLDTAEGREILRNWLACRAPVIERAEDVPAPRVVGDYCGDERVGDCVYGAPRDVRPPEPRWSAIYARVFVPLCVSCHGPGRTDYRDESQLDLRTADVAYEALVGTAATGAFCNERGLTHVVPGDPDASSLLAKLGADVPCGERMPQGGPFLPDEVIAPVRAWIAAGAPND
jgi:hypothetical protein